MSEPTPEGPVDPDLRLLERRLLRHVSHAISDFRMIEAGDRIMVCLSGGKDSYTLLWLLRHLAERAPIPFELVAVNLDQKQPGFPEDVLPAWLEDQGFAYRVVERDTYSIVTSKLPDGSTYCSLCSRLRRAILYDVAAELGATKIALGHHREDLNETLLMSALYSGQLQTMPPLLRSDDGRHVVIRPMAYVPEAMIAEYADRRGFPIIPCGLCGSQEGLQRERVKTLLAELTRDNPHIPGNLASAMRSVRVSQLLDRDLWERVGFDPLEAPESAAARVAQDAPGVVDRASEESGDVRVPLAALSASRGRR